jgi:hypothetical protein
MWYLSNTSQPREVHLPQARQSGSSYCVWKCVQLAQTFFFHCRIADRPSKTVFGAFLLAVVIYKVIQHFRRRRQLSAARPFASLGAELRQTRLRDQQASLLQSPRDSDLPPSYHDVNRQSVQGVQAPQFPAPAHSAPPYSV